MPHHHTFNFVTDREAQLKIMMVLCFNSPPFFIHQNVGTDLTRVGAIKFEIYTFLCMEGKNPFVVGVNKQVIFFCQLKHTYKL